MQADFHFYRRVSTLEASWWRDTVNASGVQCCYPVPFEQEFRGIGFFSSCTFKISNAVISTYDVILEHTAGLLKS